MHIKHLVVQRHVLIQIGHDDHGSKVHAHLGYREDCKQNVHPLLKGIALKSTSGAQPLAPLDAGVCRLSALAGCSHAEKN
jgi:hypothetical protein